jgi:hypothetical protein
MDAQNIAVDHTNQILNMIGPHGLFAIIAVIVMVRVIGSLTYFSKPALFLITVMISIVFGGLAVYFNLDNATGKQIAGGAFMTTLGSPIVYELLRWSIRFLISFRRGQAGEKELRALYWYLSPKSVQVVVTGPDGKKHKETIPPDADLTRMTEFLRIDKAVKKKAGTVKKSRAGDDKEDDTIRNL